MAAIVGRCWLCQYKAVPASDRLGRVLRTPIKQRTRRTSAIADPSMRALTGRLPRGHMAWADEPGLYVTVSPFGPMNTIRPLLVL